MDATDSRAKGSLAIADHKWRFSFPDNNARIGTRIIWSDTVDVFDNLLTTNCKIFLKGSEITIFVKKKINQLEHTFTDMAASQPICLICNLA